MERLEAEQDPGPARLKQSQNPAESPINTDSLIKIAPEAENLHQPQCSSRADCSYTVESLQPELNPVTSEIHYLNLNLESFFLYCHFLPILT